MHKSIKIVNSMTGITDESIAACSTIISYSASLAACTYITDLYHFPVTQRNIVYKRDPIVVDQLHPSINDSIYRIMKNLT